MNTNASMFDAVYVTVYWAVDWAVFGAVCGRVGLATGAVVYWAVNRAWGLSMGRAVDQAGCDEAPHPALVVFLSDSCAYGVALR